MLTLCLNGAKMAVAINSYSHFCTITPSILDIAKCSVRGIRDGVFVGI